MAALISLSREWESFQQNAPDYIFAEPITDNLLHWSAEIVGPPNTPFEGGVFVLDIIYTEEHPFKPPKCTMKTKMFHPNISSIGEIYIEILKHDWVPTLTTEAILLSISSILDTPLMDNPINHEAARFFRKDRDKYNSIVRAYTLKYATDSSHQDLQPELLHTEYQDLHPESLHTEVNNSSSYYLLDFPFLLMMLAIAVMIFAVFICFLS